MFETPHRSRSRKKDDPDPGIRTCFQDHDRYRARVFLLLRLSMLGRVRPRRFVSGIWVLVVLWMTLLPPATAQNLTDALVSVVSQRLAEGASHRRVFSFLHLTTFHSPRSQSWEYGTRSEVILEYNASSYSVLSSSEVPPPQQIPPSLTGALSDVFSIAHMIVSNRSISNGNVTGPQPLIQDSSAGDPASIGVAVLLANWTGQSASDGLDYSGAARDQLAFLFQKVPKTKDGAISHRMDQVQLW